MAFGVKEVSRLPRPFYLSVINKFSVLFQTLHRQGPSRIIGKPNLLRCVRLDPLTVCNFERSSPLQSNAIVMLASDLVQYTSFHRTSRITSRRSGESALYRIDPSWSILGADLPASSGSLVRSATKAAHGLFTGLLGGFLRAAVLRSLIFCFALFAASFSFRFAIFAANASFCFSVKIFSRRLLGLDFALVLDLDVVLALVLGLGLGLRFAFTFSLVDFVAVAAFFDGAVVVRPVCALGLDTGLSA